MLDPPEHVGARHGAFGIGVLESDTFIEEAIEDGIEAVGINDAHQGVVVLSGKEPVDRDFRHVTPLSALE